MGAAPRAAVLPVRAAVVAAVLLLAASMTYTLVALASTTVLIMGGTGHSLATPPDTIPYVRQYMDRAVDNYVSPASAGGIPYGPYNGVAVITPEQDAPNYGTMPIAESIRQGLAALHNCLTSHSCDHNTAMGSAAPSPTDTFVVFGFSQSATIAMLEKARLAAEYAAGEGPDVSFVVIGAPRPNGGLSQRDPMGIMTRLLFARQYPEWINDPGPTDTPYPTANIALQYDGFTDFPLNPLNLLAVANAYLGIILTHTTYGEHSLSDPGVIDQGRYGDTRYYLIPADVVPLLKPVQNIPLIGRALADSWDPVLRVIIESAYDRSISPGVPTPFDILYFENPVRFIVSLLAAVPVGIDNGFESLFGVRPLGTQRPGPYGVGGWDTIASGPVGDEVMEIEADIPDDSANRAAAAEDTESAEAVPTGNDNGEDPDPATSNTDDEEKTSSPSDDDIDDSLDDLAPADEGDDVSEASVENPDPTTDSTSEPGRSSDSLSQDDGSRDGGRDSTVQREQDDHQQAA
ncbi:PE-PPE domain-containing protein [Mycolicibacterium phlei]|jgi:hypothetical protein